jgi:predicted phage tail component-like protein
VDTIGDKSFEELGLTILKNYQRPISPDTVDYTTRIPGQHGAWDFGADLSPREFWLPCILKKQTPAALQEAINTVSDHFYDATGRPKTLDLVFGDEPEKTYRVRIMGGISISRIIGIGQFTLPLVAFDPFSYLSIESSQITWGSEIITFYSDISLGTKTEDTKTLTAPGIYTASVNGTVNPRPIFDISGSADDLTVSFNGKSFSLPNFSNVDWVINSKNYTVTKDGVDTLSSLTGDEISTFELLRGDNEIQIDGSNMDISFKVRFDDMYM